MSRARTALIWTGGAALMAAALVDTVFVIGRHIGAPVHGAIEMVEAAILVSGGCAMVMASLAGIHARVHVVLDRLPAGLKALAHRTGDLLTALFFAGLLGGALWIAGDLWASHERSELLGIPWRVLRAFLNICLAAALLALLRHVLRGHEKGTGA